MQDIQRFKDFVEDINSSNSRLYKEQVLRNYVDDEVIKEVLHFIYNPYIVTGISDKKINKSVKSLLLLERIQGLHGLFEYLKENNTGTDLTIGVIQNYIRNLPEDCRELAKSIITKNIQLGVDATTINKIMNNLIPVFDIQLAEKYFDFPNAIGDREFTITTKIDGGRIIVIKKDGKVKFFTRAGQEYYGLVDIQKELEECQYNNFVLDGEITLIDKGNLNSKEQYKETMKITRKDGEKHGVKILAFDILTVDEFEHQLETLEYHKRRFILDGMFDNFKFVEVLPVLYSGSDQTMIMKLLDEQVANGEEGIMININDAPYRFKRTKDLLKVKKMQDVDLKIIGFEEGKNKYAGTLGAIIIDYKGYRLGVGTGISDELRDEIWNNQDKYMGVTIAVQYFEETTNDQGGLGLRFPVFVDFRFDKPM